MKHPKLFDVVAYNLESSTVGVLARRLTREAAERHIQDANRAFPDAASVRVAVTSGSYQPGQRWTGRR